MSTNYSNSGQNRGFGWRGVTAVSLIVLLLGLALAGWILMRLDLISFGSKDSANSTAPSQLQAPSTANRPVSEVEAKVAELESRIAQIGSTGPVAAVAVADMQANSVVAALRARRAIEAGSGFDQVQTQLRQQFGRSHTNEVKAIEEAAKYPTSLASLKESLSQNDLELAGRGADVGFIDRMQLAIADLFVLRRRGTPSHSPTLIIQRADQKLANSDLRGAIEEIERLPQSAQKDEWLQSAKRYLAAMVSLDIIERAALQSAPNPEKVLPVSPQLLPGSANAPVIIPPAGTVPVLPQNPAANPENSKPNNE